MHRILCNCHTTLLEHPLGPSLLAYEGTGASSNDGTDALANEANSRRIVEGKWMERDTAPCMNRVAIDSKKISVSKLEIWKEAKDVEKGKWSK